MSATATTSLAPSAFCLPVGKLPKVLKHKRRFCRHQGCNSIVKSQGLCQRHGAKPRLCKISACQKQAQGNYNGMCKAHYKIHCSEATGTAAATTTTTTFPTQQQLPAVAPVSVYDSILPNSIAWDNNAKQTMPLIQFLSGNRTQPAGWHRQQERAARGMSTATSTTDFEDWERELMATESLLLTGCADDDIFDLQAHAWGQTSAGEMRQGILQQHLMSLASSQRPSKKQKTRHSVQSVAMFQQESTQEEDEDILAAADWLFTSFNSNNTSETVVSEEDQDTKPQYQHKRLFSFSNYSEQQHHKRMYSFASNPDPQNHHKRIFSFASNNFSYDEVSDQEIEEILLSSAEDDY